MPQGRVLWVLAGDAQKNQKQRPAASSTPALAGCSAVGHMEHSLCWLLGHFSAAMAGDTFDASALNQTALCPLGAVGGKIAQRTALH